MAMTQPERDALDAKWAAGAKGRKVAQIKAEAGRRILAVLPEWEQRNLTARSVELLHIGKAAWTTEEAAEAAAIDALWAGAKAIRSISDDLEASLDGMTAEELAAFDPTDDAHWGA